MKCHGLFFVRAVVLLLMAGRFATPSIPQNLYDQQSLAGDPAGILSPPALQIVGMAASGASDDYLLAFIANYPSTFGLTAQSIICLQDMGISSTVTLAMLNHDLFLNNNPNALPPISLATPDTGPQILPSATLPDATTPPLFSDFSPQMDDSFSTLAPYGSWDFLAGSGWCWQPSGWLGYFSYPWGLTQLSNGCWWRHPNRGWLWFPNSNFQGNQNAVVASRHVNPGQTHANPAGRHSTATHHGRH
ncbi:MAG TPA: hypothetical protein VFC07_15940 [Verrucomicrobiae bacterium]|nr:hypothetical protein [Verrucomicrobiae bacterium]